MTTTCDTRLDDDVLDDLGFARHPAEPGGPVRYTLIRHGVRVEVTHPPAAHGGGFDLDGMRPVDVGDLLVCLVSLGRKLGRRELLHEMLEHVEVEHVFDWVKAVRGLRFEDPVPPPVAPKKARKPAVKKPVKKSAKKPAPKKAAKRRGSGANTM